jgi:hypothetical protein
MHVLFFFFFYLKLQKCAKVKNTKIKTLNMKRGGSVELSQVLGDGLASLKSHRCMVIWGWPSLQTRVWGWPKGDSATPNHLRVVQPPPPGVGGGSAIPRGG